MPMEGADEPVWLLALSINPGAPLGGSITESKADFDRLGIELAIRTLQPPISHQPRARLQQQPRQLLSPPRLLTVPSGALYFEANITNLSPSTATPSTTLNFTFSSSVSGEFVTGGTSVNGDTWLDRGHTNAFDNPYFSDKFSASGLYSGAENGPLDVMRLGAAGVAANATVSVGVWALEDAWAAQADGNGTVLGNVTTGGGRWRDEAVLSE
ncbi:hypothetical protein L1887_47929 [Cichorium endivia]|nr:hypothetical protein L1887_47929 [Cichorium endivia]